MYDFVCVCGYVCAYGMVLKKQRQNQTIELVLLATWGKISALVFELEALVLGICLFLSQKASIVSGQYNNV